MIPNLNQYLNDTNSEKKKEEDHLTMYNHSFGIITLLKKYVQATIRFTHK